MVNKHLNRAFTVAELLIVMVVLGVIGIFTIGLLRMNTSNVEYKITQAKMMDSISTALSTMQLDNKLSGYSDSAAFADALTQYYPATKMNADEVTQAKSKVPANIEIPDDTVYLKGENGEVLAISYNKNYTPSSQYTKMAQTDKTTATNSVDFRNDALGAIKGFYDVNGLNVGPNKIGYDIQEIEPYAEGTEANCANNYVINSGGACICAITPNECVAMGKIFNESACACEVNCPVGKVYSEEVGQCICTLTAESCQAPYATFDEESCTCKVNIGAPAKCTENGGTWDVDAATCICPAATDKNSCEYKSNGYAVADKNNFCKCACKSSSEIKALISSKAANRADKAIVEQYTIPTTDVENGCVVCGEKSADITSYNIEMQNGMCVTKGLVEPNPYCDGYFCEWVDFPQYYNKCTLTQAKCNAILDEAHEEYFGYPARSNECYSDGSDKCRKNVDACIKDPKSNECINSIKNCQNRTSTPHYGCSMKFHGSWANTVVNGKLTPVLPSGIGIEANATVDNCYCSVSQGRIEASVPRTTYFHGAYGIAEANKYTNFTGKDLPAFKGAYMDPDKSLITSIQNVMVLESYTSWYDPIVLNVSANDAYAAPATTSKIDVAFKGIDGKDITTAWIAAYEKPMYYFLVNDKNKNNQVDNLSELYSEAGGLVTGLQMLNEDFGYKAEDAVVIGYPKLKNLKAWADMNSNAKVDDGDVFENLLVLTAVEDIQEEAVIENNYDSLKDILEQNKDSLSKMRKEAEEYVNSTKGKKETTYKFSNISGIGVYEIYTGYTAISEKDGTPMRSGNSTIAIQSKYTILKPISGLDNSKYWVEIVPTAAGENPAVKYVTQDGKTVEKETKVWASSDKRLVGVEKLKWENEYTPTIYTNKTIALYLKVNDQYYELQTRGLTDVIFDKK